MENSYSEEEEEEFVEEYSRSPAVPVAESCICARSVQGHCLCDRYPSIPPLNTDICPMGWLGRDPLGVICGHLVQGKNFQPLMGLLRTNHALRALAIDIILSTPVDNVGKYNQILAILLAHHCNLAEKKTLHIIEKWDIFTHCWDQWIVHERGRLASMVAFLSTVKLEATGVEFSVSRLLASCYKPWELLLRWFSNPAEGETNPLIQFANWGNTAKTVYEQAIRKSHILPLVDDVRSEIRRREIELDHARKRERDLLEKSTTIVSGFYKLIDDNPHLAEFAQIPKYARLDDDDDDDDD